MDISPVLICSILVLALGILAFRASGPLLRSRISFPQRAERLIEISATVLLASLVATTALVEGPGSAGIARPTGVLVAGVLAWRKLPFAVVILSARRGHRRAAAAGSALTTGAACAAHPRPRSQRRPPGVRLARGRLVA